MKQQQMMRLVLGSFCAVLALGLVGCEPANNSVAEKQEEPSLKGVVTELVEMRNQIRDGFASNNVDLAHEPLHEVGHCLEKLDNIAQIEGLSEDKRNAISKAKEELFEAFGEVDKTLHGQEGKTYDEVCDVVDKALKVITDIAGVKNDAAPVTEGSVTAADEVPTGEGDAVVEEAPAGEEGE